MLSNFQRIMVFARDIDRSLEAGLVLNVLLQHMGRSANNLAQILHDCAEGVSLYSYKLWMCVETCAHDNPIETVL